METESKSINIKNSILAILLIIIIFAISSFYTLATIILISALFYAHYSYYHSNPIISREELEEKIEYYKGKEKSPDQLKKMEAQLKKMPTTTDSENKSKKNLSVRYVIVATLLTILVLYFEWLMGYAIISDKLINTFN